MSDKFCVLYDTFECIDILFVNDRKRYCKPKLVIDRYNIQKVAFLSDYIRTREVK